MLVVETEVLNPIPQFFMNITVSFKAPGSRNLNQLYALSKINVCETLKNPSLILRGIIDCCKRYFSNVCHNCPYPVGLLALNYSEPLTEQSCSNMTNKFMPNLLSSTWYPDGDYRAQTINHSNSNSKI
ncbi:hypothetical protein ACKWTF_009488 [Chironomus riparius]